MNTESAPFTSLMDWTCWPPPAMFGLRMGRALQQLFESSMIGAQPQTRLVSGSGESSPDRIAAAKGWHQPL